MSRLRALLRRVTVWQVGTLLAAILVALLALVVVDAVQARRDADRQRDAVITELQRRGVRIDALTEQLDEAASSRDRLAEEVRALREQLIDAGMLDPRPADPAPRPTPGASGAARPAPAPRTAPTAPSSSPPSSPSPSPTPSPSPSPTCARVVLGACLPL